MPYKKGDVLIRDEYRTEVLEVLGDIYFCSETWDQPEYAERSTKIGGHFRTEYELNENGWSLCPPDQTLLPAEKWVPKKGDSVFNGMVNEEGKAISEKITWGDFRLSYQNGLLAIGNVHKTSEEAIAFARKRYNVE